MSPLALCSQFFDKFVYIGFRIPQTGINHQDCPGFRDGDDLIVMAKMCSKTLDDNHI